MDLYAEIAALVAEVFTKLTLPDAASFGDAVTSTLNSSFMSM